MVVPLGKVMGSAVLLDKVYYWSVEFIAPSHFQFTRLLCVCGQRCDLSFPLQPPAAISPQLSEAKISSFSKLHWSWCFTIATESYQSTTWASLHLLAPLFQQHFTVCSAQAFSSIAKLIPILLILKLFYHQFECLFLFNCSGQTVQSKRTSLSCVWVVSIFISLFFTIYLPVDLQSGFQCSISGFPSSL